MAEPRFPLLAATRWLVGAAVVLGALGIALAPDTGRLIYAVLTGAVIVLWAIGRLRRPSVVVGAEGYRVEVRGRAVLRVLFSEVKRARAVPADHAMYVDTGDPARNLLVPPPGHGFRFARQADLYALLAERLADRVEIVEELAPDPFAKKKKKS